MTEEKQNDDRTFLNVGLDGFKEGLVEFYEIATPTYWRNILQTNLQRAFFGKIHPDGSLPNGPA